MPQVRIERRGKSGMDTAQKLYVTRDENGERFLPAPTGAALAERTLGVIDTVITELGEFTSERSAEIDDKIDEAEAARAAAQTQANAAAAVVAGAASIVANVPLSEAARSGAEAARDALKGAGWADNRHPDPMFENFAPGQNPQPWARPLAVKNRIAALESNGTGSAVTWMGPLVPVADLPGGKLSASVVIAEKIGDQGQSFGVAGDNLRVRLAAYAADGTTRLTGSIWPVEGTDAPSDRSYYTRNLPVADITTPTTLTIAENITYPAAAVFVRIEVREQTAVKMYLAFPSIRPGSSAAFTAPYVGRGYRRAVISPTGSDSTGTGSKANPWASPDRALDALGGVGDLMLATGDFTASRFDIRKMRDIAIIGDDTSTFGRSIIRYGTKLAAITKTGGRTKVYQAQIAGLGGVPNWIWQDNVADTSRPISYLEQHALTRGKAFRLPCVRIDMTIATTLAAALTEIDASAAPLQWWDASNGTIYFSVQGGGDATAASIYVTTSSAATLLAGISETYVWTPVANTIRLHNFDVRYGGISMRSACRRTLMTDVSVLGAPSNAFEVMWDTEMRRCEGAGFGSGVTGGLGDGLNGHNRLDLDDFDCWMHDGRDDGHSIHENSRGFSRNLLSQDNYGSGLCPAYGAEQYAERLVTIRNALTSARFPRIKNGGVDVVTAYTGGGLPVPADDNGVITYCEVRDGLSIGDKNGYTDTYTTNAGIAGVLKTVRCRAVDPAVYGFNNSAIDDCRHLGSGTARHVNAGGLMLRGAGAVVA